MGGAISTPTPSSSPCSGADRDNSTWHLSFAHRFHHKNDPFADPDEFEAGFLHYACRQGTLSTVRYLVEKQKYNVEALAYGGMTPLHCACQTGRLSIVKYLVFEQNVDVDARATRLGLPRQSALEIAFNNGRMEVVRFLVTVVLINAEVMRLAWMKNFPWDVRWQLLEYYHPTRRGQRNEWFRTYPLQAILSCPLPSHKAFMECIIQFPPTCWVLIDEQGRLPLHVALGSARKTESVSPELILKLMTWEPRVARMKDPTTSLYPFLAASLVRRDSKDADRRSSWLDVVFSLLRDQDPELLLSSSRRKRRPQCKVE